MAYSPQKTTIYVNSLDVLITVKLSEQSRMSTYNTSLTNLQSNQARLIAGLRRPEKSLSGASYPLGIKKEFLSSLSWVSSVQSLNSLFFPPPIGAEPGRAKIESRITCMHMLRTKQTKKILESIPRCLRQCVAKYFFQLAL